MHLERGLGRSADAALAARFRVYLGFSGACRDMNSLGQAVKWAGSHLIPMGPVPCYP